MDNRIEAIQCVVDSVSAHQDGAAAGTLQKALTASAREADLDLTDDEARILADAIDQHGGDIRVADVLT